VSAESGPPAQQIPRVRAAAPADAATIADLAARAWREGFRGIVPDEIDPERAWRSDRIEARLAGRVDDDAVILAAELGGRVAGFVLCGRCRDDDAGPTTGEIWALYVDPDRWRSGVGRALVDAALEDLRARGLAESTVWTLADSPRNLRFYEALGFELDGAQQRRESFGAPLEVRLRRPP
jgi:ribosomal protein S18 acetylase RimI-like enzyme